MTNLLLLQSRYFLCSISIYCKYSKIDRTDSGNINLHTSQPSLKLKRIAKYDRSTSRRRGNLRLPVVMGIISHSSLNLKLGKLERVSWVLMLRVKTHLIPNIKPKDVAMDRQCFTICARRKSFRNGWTGLLDGIIRTEFFNCEFCKQAKCIVIDFSICSGDLECFPALYCMHQKSHLHVLLILLCSSVISSSYSANSLQRICLAWNACFWRD